MGKNVCQINILPNLNIINVADQKIPFRITHRFSKRQNKTKFRH